MIAEPASAGKAFAARLLQEFQEWWEGAVRVESAEVLEAHLQERLRQVGREALELLCQQVSEQRERAAVPQCCGRRMDHHSRRLRTVLTLFGAVRVQRRYYRCLRCGRSVFPADAWLGWRGGFSHHLEEAVAWECSLLPYREALGSLRKFLGVELSVHGAEQIVARWGEPEVVPAPYAQRVPGSLVVQLDGTTAHLAEGWKEVKLAAYFGWERTDPEAVPAQVSYIGDWLSAEEFAEPLWAEALVRGAPVAEQIAVIGDGAGWVWQTASLLFPRATQILDWYHLAAHLSGAAKMVHGEGTELTHRLREQWKTEVWEGRSEGAEEHLRELVFQGRDDRGHTLRKCADYLQTHQHRLRYPLFRAMGWPVGSGVVEGGCKHVIDLRFKRKSTRWTRAGARAVLRLRLDRLNGRWAPRCAHMRQAA